MEQTVGNETVLRKKAMTLPFEPGVYLMHDSSGEVIYVGKAKALRNRVSQYFGSHRNHGAKVIRMVSHVADFEYIVCASEYEALMLECSLIKQYMPKYNILLKDDKGYHYIKVTKGAWPTISAAMQKEEDDADYLGPYYSSFIVRQTVDSARRAFRLPTCSRPLGNKKLNGRPCLNYYIKNCSAPCCSMISNADYNESVAKALRFIKSGAGESVKELKKEMAVASENLEFERAALLRDRIAAIEKIAVKQTVVSGTYQEQDVLAAASDGNTVCFELFLVREGNLTDRREFLTDLMEDLPSAKSEFLLSYYAEPDLIPKRILLDEVLPDAADLERILSERSGHAVHLVTPQIGDQKQLIETCRTNAAERLTHELSFTGNHLKALEELKDLLHLETLPRYIESYDISNTAGSENVAGMVIFVDGAPFKSGYKKFRIQSFVGQDDFRSMAEVLDRRFAEYEKAEDETGFGRLPDLILLDGGKGQVSAVEQIIKAHHLNVPLFGMVKDSKHRTRAVTAGGDDIEIKANRRVYTLVSTIQEEVHRFAISFHRSRSAKKGVASTLLEIPGVGDVRRKALIKTFKTVSALSQAEKEDIAAVPGIDAKTAASVYAYFHPEKEKDTK